MKRKILNFGWGDITVQWNDDKPGEMSEMCVYDSIGKDPWTGEGITASDFKKALSELPKDRNLVLKINSRGGDVREGITMDHALLDWKNKTGMKVYMVVDGIAASTASWFALNAADEVHAYRNSQMFIHDAISFSFGNADDFRKAADDLDKTSDQIAQMYSDKSGKGKRTMRDLMKNNTLMTGEEALESGIVDKLLDGKAVRNFTANEMGTMTNVLGRIYNSVAMRGGATNNKEQTMNKKTVIKILNAHGVKEWEGKPITEETSEEHLEAALNSIGKKTEPEKKTDPGKQPDTKIVQLSNEEIEQFRNEREAFRKEREKDLREKVTRDVDQLIIDDKLDAIERDKYIGLQIRDIIEGVKDGERILDVVSKRKGRAPGPSPIAPNLELIGNSIHEVERHMLDNGPRFMDNFIGPKRTGGKLGDSVLKDIRDHAVAVGKAWKQHRNMLLEMLNANTIDAGLQRQVILQEMLEEFRIVLAPLQYFCTVFSNVPLEGTDEVDVPFYPLSANASTSWNPANGYNTLGGTVTNTRPVLVGGNGTAAAANTARDRKWRAIGLSSYELARQPYLNYVKLMIQEANALAVDIFKDIVKSVITAANFAGAVKTTAAAQFSSDDIADLWEQATGRNWPQSNRCLVLDHRYKTPLLKDPSFKQYLAAGTDETLRRAAIRQAYNFDDIPIVPNLASYSPVGENLQGWINHMSALLVATAPIMPAPAVRALLIRYDVVAHPDIGIAFEYRRFGDTTLDVDKETVEVSYGANKGVASALGRITSA